MGVLEALFVPNKRKRTKKEQKIASKAHLTRANIKFSFLWRNLITLPLRAEPPPVHHHHHPLRSGTQKKLRANARQSQAPSFFGSFFKGEMRTEIESKRSTAKERKKTHTHTHLNESLSRRVRDGGGGGLVDNLVCAGERLAGMGEENERKKTLN